MDFPVLRRIESLELRVGPSQREVPGHNVTRQFPVVDKDVP